MKRVPQPDRIKANNTISRAQILINEANSILSAFEVQRLTVVNSYKRLKEETTQVILANISIERLNEAGQGLRIAAIQNAGIQNVAELLRMSEQKLQKIRGVGEQTARQARSASINIARSIEKSVQVRIDPEQHKSASTNLLRALFCIRKNKEKSVTCTKILNANRSQIERYIEGAKLTMQKFRWFISRQNTRTTAVSALNEIENFLNSNEAKVLAQFVLDFRLSVSCSDVQAWEDFEAHSADYYAILESITGVKTGERKTQGDLPLDLVGRIESNELNSSLLKSSLRGYQVFGAKYAIVQRYTLIGDEMGLGKTVEAIAAMAHLQAEGARYFVVVCPASVLINWCREIVHHSHLKVYKVHGRDKEKQLAEWAQTGCVAVTTYETISIINLPPEVELDMLVADEAHYAKNPYALRTMSLKDLTKNSKRVLFMTGNSNREPCRRDE